MTKEKKSPDLIAYTVREGASRAYFHRVGVAWNNKKGGAKVVLEAMPINGEILLLPAEKKPNP